MVNVGGYISEIDAANLKQSSFGELRKHLEDACRGINEEVAVQLNDDDEETKARLNEIQTLLGTLHKEVLAANGDLAPKMLTERLMALMGLFDALPADVRFKTTTIAFETASVFANASARSFADAQAIVDDYEKSSTGRNSHLKEYIRIAKEFGLRFPTLMGYRIKTEGDRQGVWIYVVDPPPNSPKDAPDVLKVLQPKVEEFLQWELLKNGDNFEYRLTAMTHRESRMISCEIIGDLLR